MRLEKSVHRAFSDAIEKGDKEVVQTLARQHPELVNHPDWTPPPLHCAVLWNQAPIVEVLLDLGADIEMRDPDRGTTPIRYAIMYCRTEVIPILLSRGANVGPIVENGITAVQLTQLAAAGEYQDYEDLPSPEQYHIVLKLLEKLGIE